MINLGDVRYHTPSSPRDAMRAALYEADLRFVGLVQARSNARWITAFAVAWFVVAIWAQHAVTSLVCVTAITHSIIAWAAVRCARGRHDAAQADHDAAATAYFESTHQR